MLGGNTLYIWRRMCMDMWTSWIFSSTLERSQIGRHVLGAISPFPAHALELFRALDSAFSSLLFDFHRFSANFVFCNEGPKNPIPIKMPSMYEAETRTFRHGISPLRICLISNPSSEAFGWDRAMVVSNDICFSIQIFKIKSVFLC